MGRVVGKGLAKSGWMARACRDQYAALVNGKDRRYPTWSRISNSAATGRSRDHDCLGAAIVVVLPSIPPASGSSPVRA